MPPTRDRGAVEVLTHAFARDPGYQHICAPPDAGFLRRLRAALAALVTLLRAAGADVLAIDHGGVPVAVAVVLEPGRRLPTRAQLRWIVRMWRGAGLRAMWRTARNAWACEAHRPREPLHHLVLLGVDPAAQGLGLARRLADTVAATARAHPTSHGVCLETENPANVPFYQHLGYEVHARFRWDRLDVHTLVLRTSERP
jgi:GNAT superfamily N-acetyltransferase